MKRPAPPVKATATADASGILGFSALYPLRGAEALVLVAALGTAFWVFALLVPEYCLSALRDAESLGALPMGRLVALISALPAVILFLPLLFYTLQYLGRILVASAQGDDRPPRPPDRNFDGFLNGLSPWVLWLVSGVSVGLLPLAVYWTVGGHREPIPTLGLSFFGLPYALMALLMTFLHDDALAAMPWRVVAAMAKVGPSLIGLAVVVAIAVGVVSAAWAGTLALRANYFWLYLLVGLACWFLALWVAMVVMHALGAYYYHRRKRLRWNRNRPRWGVHWGL